MKSPLSTGVTAAGSGGTPRRGSTSGPLGLLGRGGPGSPVTPPDDGDAAPLSATPIARAAIPPQEAAANPDLDVLRWLAACHRNRYVLTEDPPRKSLESLPIREDSESSEAREALRYLKGLATSAGVARFMVDYEPRSLEVTADGSRVVVGTKAGTIHLARWSAKDGRWSFTKEADLWAKLGLRDRSAIRAVRVLEADEAATTVVAGWGAAKLALVTFSEQDPASPQAALIPEFGDPRSLEGEGQQKLDRMRRFVKLIELGPPPHAPVPGGCVWRMIGITRGGDLYIIRQRGAGHYDVILRTPRKLRQWGRIVDGTMQHGLLWLLTSNGYVLRCEYAPEENEDKRLKDPKRTYIAPPDRLASYRAIDGCAKGLAVLASDWMTFVPFEKVGEDITIAAGDPEPSQPKGVLRWHRVPDTLDFGVCHPKPADGERGHDDRIWTVVSSASPGLTWIGWQPPSPPADEGWSPAIVSGMLPSLGSASILKMRAAWCRPAGGETPGAGLLVGGTRDQLRIASVLDRSRCDAALAALVRRARRQAASNLPDSIRAQQLLSSRALSWWELRDHVEGLFAAVLGRYSQLFSTTSDAAQEGVANRSSTPAGPGAGDLAVPGLDCVDKDSLRQLTLLLMNRWRSACERLSAALPNVDDKNALSQVLSVVRQQSSELQLAVVEMDLLNSSELQRAVVEMDLFKSEAMEGPEEMLDQEQARARSIADCEREIDRQLKAWVLRLLQRAHHFGPDVAQQIGRLIYKHLIASSGPRASAGAATDTQLFALFLRKWIIRGGTDAEGTTQLAKRYDWNTTCGKPLDALAYLIKLMRRREDLGWVCSTRAAGPGQPVLDLQASAEPVGSSRFFVVSCTDGCISAITETGHRLPWQIEPSVDLQGARLLRAHDGMSLSRWDTEQFFDEYHNRPYARKVVMEPLGIGGYHLLVFCCKGWRSPQHPDQEPRLYALVVRPRIAGEADTDQARGADADRAVALVVESVMSLPMKSETYGISVLEHGKAERAFSIRFAVGITGSWSSSSLPFAEVEIRGELRDEGSGEARKKRVSLRTIEPHLPTIEASTERRRSTLAEPAYNPCWSFAHAPRAEGGKGTLWAGFDDGHIRGYRWRGDRWEDAAWSSNEGSEPRGAGFKASAAVWRLHAFTASGASGEERLLAYGTADGVVGVVSIDEAESASKQVDASAQPAARPRYAGAHYGSVRHRVHTRESSPICGLLRYSDDGEDRLLALSQDGIVTLFDLSPARLDRCQAGPCGSLPRRPLRPSYPGLRLDRFRLSHMARAITAGAPGSDGLQLLVGSDDGRVYLHKILFPRGSQRRKEMRAPLERLAGDLDELKLCVGDTDTHAWLRVLDVGGSTFVRFSLWDELRPLADAVDPMPARAPEPGAPEPPVPPFDAAAFHAFTTRLNELARDIYRRVPFSKDAVKVLWQEGAKLANRIAAYAVCSEVDREARLDAYYKLNLDIDDLCNQWIGFAQSIEAKVLAHTFNELFDWSDVVLIAALDEPSAHKLREVIVGTFIRRRLGYADPMVAFEALRAINAAMLRAMVHDRDGGGHRWQFRMAPFRGPGEGTRPLGFLDLLRMVGGLAARLSGSLASSDPLSTELTNFFALSLLLVPDSALLTAQVVSESRLVEQLSAWAEAIFAQAHAFAEVLGMRLDGVDRKVAEGLDRFRDSFHGYADLELITYPPGPAGPDPSAAWRRLANGAPAEPPPPAEHLSDKAFLYQQRTVLRLTSWLAWLDAEERLAAIAARCPDDAVRIANEFSEEQLDWPSYGDLHKNGDASTPMFFRHSRAVLTQLYAFRAQIRRSMGLLAGVGADGVREDPMAICESAQRMLDTADLFQPQLAHYRQLIGAWRRALYVRGLGAARVLTILDKFNRHVYRTSADGLMASILELAMQAHPISFDEVDDSARGRSPHSPSGGPGRALRGLMLHRLKQLDAGSPLRDIFERGDRLVNSTHMATTLLIVARERIRRVLSATDVRRENTTVGVIREEFETAIGQFGMNWMPLGEIDDETEAPGLQELWSFIAHEAATNAARYGFRGSNGQHNDATLWIGMEGQRAVLRFAYGGAYLSSLPADHPLRAACDAATEPVAKAAVIEAKLNELWKPGVRCHTSIGGSSGMGLYLIGELVDFADMRRELKLLQPGDKPERQRHETEGTWARRRIRYPLCLEISWQAAPKAD
ncbi:hypothetical protein WMF30_19555 [Sorangium sp. So ce134]